MKTIEMRRYEMLVRVRDFGKTHGDLFPESTLASQEFAEVAAAVKQLSEHAVSKKSTARDGVRTRAVARDTLAGRLDTISRTARAMAEDTPGLEDKFGMPARRTDAALLTAGRQFLRDGEELKGQFLLHGMPKTFLADLQETVESFERALRERDEGKGANASARANIAAALDAGLAAVRKLNVIVTNRLEDDAGMMARWEKERQVIYPTPRRKRPAPAPEAPTPSSPPASTATPPPAPVTTPASEPAPMPAAPETKVA